jgi:hypothetical protein
MHSYLEVILSPNWSVDLMLMDLGDTVAQFKCSSASQYELPYDWAQTQNILQLQSLGIATVGLPLEFFLEYVASKVSSGHLEEARMFTSNMNYEPHARRRLIDSCRCIISSQLSSSHYLRFGIQTWVITEMQCQPWDMSTLLCYEVNEIDP